MEYQDFVEKVLDYTLSISGGTICLGTIAGDLGLDLTQPEMYTKEKLSNEHLRHLAEELPQLNKEIEEWEKVLHSKEWSEASKIGHEAELNALYSSFPWRKKYPKYDLADYLGLLQNRKSRYENTIQNDGVVVTPLLGSFSSSDKKVYLYLENIKKSAPEHQNGKTILTKPIIKTFIHEMFHAWNYFACGKKGRTVRGIEEAMVEFATLYFLSQISQVHSEFEPIFEWVEKNIKEKQTAVGGLPAYGYGYYLYSKLLKNKPQVMELFMLYSKNSGLIQPSSLVKHIENMLYPFYPYDREEEVYTELQQLLIKNYKIKGQVWTDSGKTNIVNSDDSLLFENCVDSITRMDIENHSSRKNLVLVRYNSLMRIYKELHGTWSPAFDDEFDDVKTILYGRHHVILVKRHCDGKAFLISPSDIRRIFDSSLEEEIPAFDLSHCMTADDFSYREEQEELYLFSESDGIYCYIFPFFRPQTRVVEIDDPNKIYYFYKLGLKYVYINSNEKVYIHSIEGAKIGEFDGAFDFSDDSESEENHEFMTVEKNGKYNYFSFEKKSFFSDEWYDDCDMPEMVNGEWILKVKINGTYKVFDIAGNDVTSKYKDALDKWIEDSKKRMKS
jgi:hypothetical protein